MCQAAFEKRGNELELKFVSLLHDMRSLEKKGERHTKCMDHPQWFPFFQPPSHESERSHDSIIYYACSVCELVGLCCAVSSSATGRDNEAERAYPIIWTGMRFLGILLKNLQHSTISLDNFLMSPKTLKSIWATRGRAPKWTQKPIRLYNSMIGELIKLL